MNRMSDTSSSAQEAADKLSRNLAGMEQDIRTAFESALGRVLDDLQTSTNARVDRALSRYEQELSSTVAAAKAKILGQAESFSTDAQSRIVSIERTASDRIEEATAGFEKTLQRIQTLLSTYSQQLDEHAQKQVEIVLKDFQSHLLDTLKQVDAHTDTEITTFIEAAKEQTINLEKTAHEQFAQEAQKYASSLLTAKNDILAKYENHLQQALPQTISDSLRKTLTPQQQQELVMDALNQLKQDSWAQ